MIIHSPEISGSLTLVGGAVIQDPVFSGSVSSVGDTGASVYSGSFSGSFQGDGSSLTGVEATALNIDSFDSEIIAGDDEILFSDTNDSGNEKRGTFASGLDSVGVISGSSQVDLEQTTNFSTFSSSVATDFSNLTSEFNEISNNPFSQSASSVTVSKAIIPTTSTIDLGSSGSPFRDLYLSSASLYINGEQVLSSTNEDLTITTAEGVSLKLRETANDTITLETANGDITLQATGTGNIELDAPIQIGAGKQILSSDGNPIAIGEDISVTGDITVTGTVDGLDLQAFSGSVASDFAALSTDYNDLQNVPAGIVSSSAQIDSLGFLQVDGDSVVSGSSQVIDILSSVNTFTSSVETGLSFDGANVTVLGNLDVQGTTTTIDSTTVQIGDNIIELNGSGVTNGGMYVSDPTAPNTDTGSFIWDSTNDYWTAGIKGSEIKVLLAEGDGVISGSSQVSVGGDLTGSADSATVTQVQGVALTSGEATQLANIDTTTISATQWGYVGGLDQELAQASTVQFGKVGVGGASDATYELKVTGDIGATGDIVAYISSDERLKDNIELISNPVEKVQELRGVTWEWNDEASDAAKDSPNVGVIAQDVEKVLPQLVHDRENGYKGVDYSKLTGLLIEAVKEQQDHISRLEERLSKLEG